MVTGRQKEVRSHLGPFSHLLQRARAIADRTKADKQVSWLAGATHKFGRSEGQASASAVTSGHLHAGPQLPSACSGRQPHIRTFNPSSIAGEPSLTPKTLVKGRREVAAWPFEIVSAGGSCGGTAGGAPTGAGC